METISYDVVGLMSGTSLDGLDMACVRFSQAEGRWQFRMLAAETVDYPEAWRQRLASLAQADGEELAAAHAAFGRYSGECVAAFVRRNRLEPLLVASHGHTVFHQPERGFTLQIGDGGALAEACGLPVVSDFRVQDVALGGQGAPLVPVGDALLFPEYDACLNIGGISNISFQEGERRIAFDISPANQLFNFLAGKRGLAYDKEGALAACGNVDERLLARMNELGYYSAPYPKSLGREWVEAELLPLLDASELPLEDRMATAVEHSAIQITSVIRERQLRRVLLTG
ncbi:MAG: anhydro-N-acetylmuramic acid kinase, partial [Bacteroidales bacterium]|nr:anhydro-N-acetylmuramic acid kinase [Bacteroidales bacterium]